MSDTVTVMGGGATVTKLVCVDVESVVPSTAVPISVGPGGVAPPLAAEVGPSVMVLGTAVTMAGLLST